MWHQPQAQEGQICARLPPTAANLTATTNHPVQDPRVGFLPRLLALLTIAYLLSPLDLLPVRA